MLTLVLGEVRHRPAVLLCPEFTLPFHASLKGNRTDKDFVQAALDGYTKAAAALQAAIDLPSLADEMKASLSKKKPAIDRRLEEIVPAAAALGLKVSTAAGWWDDAIPLLPRHLRRYYATCKAVNYRVILTQPVTF